MPSHSFGKDRRALAALAAPAFALAVAACGSSPQVSSTDAAATSVAVDEAASTEGASPSTSGSAPETTAVDDAGASVVTDETSSGTESAPSSGDQIQLLSADEAIANAQVNQPTLQLADNVLDIETLAVGDGSVQTLRNVVDGDRPVLLWFFSPH